MHWLTKTTFQNFSSWNDLRLCLRIWDYPGRMAGKVAYTKHKLSTSLIQLDTVIQFNKSRDYFQFHSMIWFRYRSKWWQAHKLLLSSWGQYLIRFLGLSSFVFLVFLSKWKVKTNACFNKYPVSRKQASDALACDASAKSIINLKVTSTSQFKITYYQIIFGTSEIM